MILIQELCFVFRGPSLRVSVTPSVKALNRMWNWYFSCLCAQKLHGVPKQPLERSAFRTCPLRLLTGLSTWPLESDSSVNSPTSFLAVFLWVLLSSSLADYHLQLITLFKECGLTLSQGPKSLWVNNMTAVVMFSHLRRLSNQLFTFLWVLLTHVNSAEKIPHLLVKWMDRME